MSVRQAPEPPGPRTVGVGAAPGVGAVTAALPLLALDPGAASAPAARTGQLVEKTDKYTVCTVDIKMAASQTVLLSMPFKIQPDAYTGKPMVNAVDMDNIVGALTRMREKDYPTYYILVPSEDKYNQDGEVLLGVVTEPTGWLRSRIAFHTTKLKEYLLRSGPTSECVIYFSKTWRLDPTIQASNYSDWGLRLGGRDKAVDKDGPPPGDPELPKKFRGQRENPFQREFCAADNSKDLWKMPKLRTYKMLINPSSPAVVGPGSDGDAVAAVEELLPDAPQRADSQGTARLDNYGWSAARLGGLAVLNRSVQAPGVAFEFDAKWSKNPNAVALSEHGRNACCILTPGSKYEAEYGTFQPIIEGVSDALFMQTTELIMPEGVAGTAGFQDVAEMRQGILNASLSRFLERKNRVATYRMPDSSKPGYNWYATPTGDVFRIAAAPEGDAREAKRQELLMEKFGQMESDKALPPELMSLCNAVANNTYVLLRFSAKLWTSMRLNMLPDDVPPPARPLFAAMLRAGNWKSVNQMLTGGVMVNDGQGQLVKRYRKTVYVNLGQFAVIKNSYVEPAPDETGARVGGTVQLGKNAEDFQKKLMNPARVHGADNQTYRLDYLLSTIIMRGAALYGSTKSSLKPFEYVNGKGECKPDATYEKLRNYVLRSSRFDGINEEMVRENARLLEARSNEYANKLRYQEASEASKKPRFFEWFYSKQELKLAELRWRRWANLQKAFLAPVSTNLASPALGHEGRVAHLTAVLDSYLGFYAPLYGTTGPYQQNLPDGREGVVRHGTEQGQTAYWHVRAYSHAGVEVLAQRITVQDILDVVDFTKHATLDLWYMAHVPRMQPLTNAPKHRRVRDAIRQMLYVAYAAHVNHITAAIADDAVAEQSAAAPAAAAADADEDPDAAPEMPIVFAPGPGPDACDSVPEPMAEA